MKTFVIVSEVEATIKLQYIVEADSLAEAKLKIIEGECRGEGERMDETINWETERNIISWEDEEQ